MIWISLDEMGRDLSGYLERVEAGETLVILRAGKPVAEVKPAGLKSNSLRSFGLSAGEFVVPDDFDAPLPENVLIDHFKTGCVEYGTHSARITEE